MGINPTVRGQFVQAALLPDLFLSLWTGQSKHFFAWAGMIPRALSTSGWPVSLTELLTAVDAESAISFSELLSTT